MRVASELYSWSTVAGLLAFPSRQLSLTITQSWPPFRFTLFFLPEQAQRAAYAARGERSAL